MPLRWCPDPTIHGPSQSQFVAILDFENLLAARENNKWGGHPEKQDGLF